MKRRFLVLLLALVLTMGLLPIQSNVVAADETETILPESVEVVPNEVVEASLPDYLVEALNSEVSTAGEFAPGSDDI